MIHLLLVVVGAAAGSIGFIVASQRQWNWHQILVANVAVCALAGGVAGGLVFTDHETVVSSLLSYGLLGTAAPFASLLLPQSAPHNVADAWRLIRRTATILAVNALFCATAASVTYIVISGSFFFVRGPVG